VACHPSPGAASPISRDTVASQTEFSGKHYPGQHSGSGARHFNFSSTFRKASTRLPNCERLSTLLRPLLTRAFASCRLADVTSLPSVKRSWDKGKGL
jgi:hypothetical protein